MPVEPDFLISFLNSSIESLEKSKETEINGIMPKEELLERLREKKNSMERMYLDNTERDADSSLSFSQSLGDKHSAPHQQEHRPHSPPHIKRLDSSKKSVSKPSTTTTTTSEDVVTTYREPSLKDSSSAAHSYNKSNGSLKGSNSLTRDIRGEEEEQAAAVDEDYAKQQTNGESGKDDKTLEKSETSDVVSDDPDVNGKGDFANSAENSQALDSEDSAAALQQQVKVALVQSGGLNAAYARPNRKVESSDVYQIVDAIRRNTNMSFDISCEALRVVLTSMEQLYNGAINPYLEAIAIHVTDKVDTPKELLGLTHDAKRLQYIFAQLADCKNDTQQRSWMVYEDEDDILQFLEELVEILNNADENICCYEMSCDQYQAMVNLVQYYQMETRWPIKRLLLKAFTAACHLDAIIVDILVTSVLPLEIVEDMKVQFSTMERLKELIKMLTIIFCLGQPMPVNHQDYLGLQFAEFLLETIESNNPENFIDLVITLILAFNLQFVDPVQNPIVEAMQTVPTVKAFTEKILLLLNREEDPVKLLKHPTNVMNSVLKMFIDVFSIKETAGLFYTTDNKVLIDIVVRQLSDLCVGNPLRRCYLELCRRIMRNTNYQEHQHRKQDFMKIFTRIFCEDTEVSAADQQLVREIANEFPQLFKA
uniref:SPIN90/Ldb17 leucine-rich domain-containing protein n=1 Tax=Glossina morsitans morsitans TaxID=37546 RepID=A0A1B0FCZ5_GLOMM